MKVCELWCACNNLDLDSVITIHVEKTGEHVSFTRGDFREVYGCESLEWKLYKGSNVIWFQITDGDLYACVEMEGDDNA